MKYIKNSRTGEIIVGNNGYMILPQLLGLNAPSALYG